MNKVKLYFRIWIRLMVRTLCRIFFIFPIRNNRIMFWSFDNAKHYTCNPKYVCEYLKKNYPEKFELVWALANKDNKKEVGDNVVVVKFRSLSWMYYVLTSKVIVVNRAIETFIPKRKGQYVINTWHGGGAYKKIGYENQIIDMLGEWLAKRQNEVIDLFVSSSKAFTELSIISAYRYTGGKILECGMPRNDIFFNFEDYNRIRDAVRLKLGLNNECVVLYAPTYRGNIRNPKIKEYSLSWDKIKNVMCKNGKNFTFLIRQHHKVIDKNCYKCADDVKDVSEYPDMQELLCASDILITDYSSSMWDFALTGKPCFFYVPDLKEYKEQDRGFFTPIETWPGIVCCDMDELCAAIETLDEKKCKKIAEEHLKYLGSYETGHACEEVCAKILEHIY